VATKEGGAITGEERIRELLGNVYGNVIGYDGRPTNDQVDRTAALAHELEDVLSSFQKLADKELPSLNSALARKKLEPIKVLTSRDWEKQRAEGGGESGIHATERHQEGQGDRFDAD
jgi:hypothetical protein